MLVILVLLTNSADNTRSHFKQFVDFVQLMHILMKSAGHLPSLGQKQMGLLSIVAVSGLDVLHSLTHGLPCIGPVHALNKFLLVAYGQPFLLFSVWFLITIAVALVYRFKHRESLFPKQQFYTAAWQVRLTVWPHCT